MTDKVRVLVVDDEEPILRLMSDALSSLGCQVRTASSGAEAMRLLERDRFDAAFLDVRMPEMDGLELLRRIRRHSSPIQVVMITGYPDVATAVEAIKLGAHDYLVKPFSVEKLAEITSQLVGRLPARGPAASTQGGPARQAPIRELVVVSPLMERIREIVASVAPTDSPVLIEGESGSGKEMVAMEIHRLSARSRGPFIPVNCGAIPSELLESELFGHVRGAFSGAVADALGVFRSAQGGTLFLDEVAELPPATQVKLLRFLQEREIRPVGSTKTYTVDVRIIAATNHRLEEAIKDGAIREDLFYRLNVVRIVVPPLRERKEGLPALVAYFLGRLNQRFDRAVQRLTPDAMAALMAYPFPGNVRELENLLERAYALGARDEITPADLPNLVAHRPDAAAAKALPTVADAERELIVQALQLCGNNRERAARALGMSRRTFYRRLKEYGVL